MQINKEKTLAEFDLNGHKIKYYSLPKLEGLGYSISNLPFSVRVVLESLLRNLDGRDIILVSVMQYFGRADFAA